MCTFFLCGALVLEFLSIDVEIYDLKLYVPERSFMYLTVSSNKFCNGGEQCVCYLTALEGGMGSEASLRYPFTLVKVTRGLGLYIKLPVLL
jgi:hypothetical protein